MTWKKNLDQKHTVRATIFPAEILFLPLFLVSSVHGATLRALVAIIERVFGPLHDILRSFFFRLIEEA